MSWADDWFPVKGPAWTHILSPKETDCCNQEQQGSLCSVLTIVYKVEARALQGGSRVGTIRGFLKECQGVLCLEGTGVFECMERMGRIFLSRRRWEVLWRTVEKWVMVGSWEALAISSESCNLKRVSWETILHPSPLDWLPLSLRVPPGPWTSHSERHSFIYRFSSH